MLIIGFSTGALAYGDFTRALSLLDNIDVNAVELSALRSAELSSLLSALPSLMLALRKRYSYISFHAPTDFTNEANLVDNLQSVAKAGINIVVHPDTISNLSLWRELGHHLCIENMDSRRRTGRTRAELQRFFTELPDAKLCFDIGHARQVDPTMLEASDILSEYGNRLAQVHLSEVNSRGKHFAMSSGARRAFEPFSSVLSQVPVILESMVEGQDIWTEVERAKKVLSNRSVRKDGYDTQWVASEATHLA